MIVFGVQHLQQSHNSKSLLLTLARYLQTISTASEGWGDGVLGAIGLRRDTVSKRRRLATRCLACVVFSLFPDTRLVLNYYDLQSILHFPSLHYSGSPCREYTTAIDELSNTVHSKKYTNLRSEGLMGIDIVSQNLNASQSGKTIEIVCALIRLFYREASFLRSLEAVWTFNPPPLLS